MSRPPDSTPPPVVADLVSTIVPVYNRANWLADAVQSVLDQTWRPIELILVDDGSTDGTPEELALLEARHPGVIRVVRRENGGPGLARETGRQLARGEFIQYLDSDDLLLPRKFEVQVGLLRAHPECDIAYGPTRLVDEEGRILKEAGKWTGREMTSLFPALLVDRWWHTNTPLYRRSLCDRIGAWPRNRPEDWDYDARAGALRARLAFCPEPLSCYRKHAGARISREAIQKYLPQEAWFLPRLHDCAVRAGVPADAPEMRHFSRWAFSLSRQVARLGLRADANRLLDLAQTAAGKAAPEITLYRWMTRLLGHAGAAALVENTRRLLRRGAGRDTLAPSWQEASDGK